MEPITTKTKKVKSKYYSDIQFDGQNYYPMVDGVFFKDLTIYNPGTVCSLEFIEQCVNDVDSLLVENLPVKVFGKDGVQHRGVGFFSDETKEYKYSKQSVPAQPLSDNLSELLTIVNTFFASTYNGILVNKYKDGIDYIGAHPDNEAHIDKCGVVAISFGTPRNFRVRDIVTKKILCNVETISGQCLVMNNTFQQNFHHEIPQQKTIISPRWSFTFRPTKQ